MTAADIPSLASESAILVLGSAMTWSVHETSPAPPPRATPCTAAIVKHGCDQRPWNSLSSLSESALFSSGVLLPPSRIMLMSAPAQKCLPSALITSALRLGEPSGECSSPVVPTDLLEVHSSISEMSDISWGLSALNASVLSRVTLATAPSTSSLQSSVPGCGSPAMSSHPEHAVARLRHLGVEAGGNR